MFLALNIPSIVLGAVIGFIVCAFVYYNNSKQASTIVKTLNEKIDELKNEIKKK